MYLQEGNIILMEGAMSAASFDMQESEETVKKAAHK